MSSPSNLMSPASPADLRLDHQICFPLYAASNLMTRLYRPLLARLGLTYPQYLVMLVLWEASPASVSELGERLMLDSGTLTPLLKRLEAAALLRRERDARDERRVLISLTQQGLALRDAATEVPRALVCRVSGAADSDLQEIAQLRTRLQALVQTLAQAQAQSLEHPLDAPAGP